MSEANAYRLLCLSMFIQFPVVILMDFVTLCRFFRRSYTADTFHSFMECRQLHKQHQAMRVVDEALQHLHAAAMAAKKDAEKEIKKSRNLRQEISEKHNIKAKE